MLHSSGQDSCPVSRAASPTAENPSVAVDIAPSTGEPEPEKTETNATPSTDALIKNLQELIARVSATSRSNPNLIIEESHSNSKIN